MIASEKRILLEDPWEPLAGWRGHHALTSIEITVTERCNMRCSYCAVGEGLRVAERSALPLSTMFARLDEVSTLRTLSLTGGEPFLVQRTVQDVLRPLLVYAKQRGITTQVNTNLTLDVARYESVADVVDVFHISHNAPDPHTYAMTSLARHPQADATVAYRWYKTMKDNASRLAAQGAFVSAETMLSPETEAHLATLHEDVIAMGCRRHEIHPLYPTSFAQHLPVLSLAQLRGAIHRLLDVRHPQVWMLFGTLPFFACGDADDQALLQRLWHAPRVTVRNDPDGRNRLNVNLFTGDVTVTDFVMTTPLGNIVQQPLLDLFERCQQHPAQMALQCHCPHARCCGPNALVKQTYYPQTQFLTRRAQLIHPEEQKGGSELC